MLILVRTNLNCQTKLLNLKYINKTFSILKMFKNFLADLGLDFFLRTFNLKWLFILLIHVYLLISLNNLDFIVFGQLCLLNEL